MRKIICFISFILLLAGCKEEMNSPAQTAANMNFFAGLDDASFEDFEGLFDEQRDERFIRDKYKLVNQLKGDSDASISTLAFIEYDNNKTAFVQLRHDVDSDKYVIYDVFEVPEEVATFLKEKLEGN